MSPYPLDPVDATGPMRVVLCAFPDPRVARRIISGVLERRLAACANEIAIRSTFLWKGRVEETDEVLVLFKTVPKRVGELFRYLGEEHPYEVPEVIELDVPRVNRTYLTYLGRTIDSSPPPPPLGGGVARSTGALRPGSRRARGARRPGRTRAPRRHP
ncbi:MAG: divalent-cation tolerance protein CutA [Thermoplasmata archaeon]|nr:divalent-cation tolerance protein CutA [Thermoplasmata archaeon]